MADLIRDLVRMRTDGFIVRARFVASIWFVRPIDGESGEDGSGMERRLFFFTSGPASYLQIFDEWYAHSVATLLASIEAFNRLGSNWTLDRIERVELKLNLVEDRSGSGHYTLPAKLRPMQAVINVDAEGECFKYALLSILHYDEVDRRHRQRTNAYREWVGELRG